MARQGGARLLVGGEARLLVRAWLLVRGERGGARLSSVGTIAPRKKSKNQLLPLKFEPIFLKLMHSFYFYKVVHPLFLSSSALRGRASGQGRLVWGGAEMRNGEG